MTRTATGRSQSSDTAQAVREALEQAQSKLQAPAHLGMLFLGPRHRLQDALQKARSLAPQTDFTGCTTAGEFTEEGLTRGGLALMLIHSDSMLFDTALVPEVSRNPVTAAKRATQNFASAKERAQRDGLAQSTSMLLVDGLCGVGPGFVDQVRKNTSPYQPIVGGAAGDDAKFVVTHVGVNDRALADGAVALHAFGDKRWGIGVGHGLQPSSEPMRVTKAEGNVLYEIEGRAAVDVYEDYARGRGERMEDTSTGAYMIAHEIGVYRFGDLHHARAPLSVGDDGSITLAADIAQDDQVCILDGEPDTMISAAASAAKEAYENLGTKAAGLIVFDCVCRGMILENRFDEEIAAIRKNFGNIPVVGFLTYGEIARYRGKLDGWHNTTAVVTAIPA